MHTWLWLLPYSVYEAYSWLAWLVPMCRILHSRLGQLLLQIISHHWWVLVCWSHVLWSWMKNCVAQKSDTETELKASANIASESSVWMMRQRFGPHLHSQWCGYVPQYRWFMSGQTTAEVETDQVCGIIVYTAIACGQRRCIVQWCYLKGGPGGTCLTTHLVNNPPLPQPNMQQQQ